MTTNKSSLQNNSSTQAEIFSLADQIHARAIDVSQRYRSAESELIEVLQALDQHRVYLCRGHSSLFQYVVAELSLSESVAYNLITVSRKAHEVPELKLAIQSGTITLSNARKITPILTFENKAEWLEKASTLSNRQLEKEVVRIFPKAATPERVSYVTESRVKLNFGLSDDEMLKLRRVQDLLSQAKRRALSLEEVLTELSNEFLRRHDPVAKARRSIVRKGSGSMSGSVASLGDSSEVLAAVKPVALQVQTKEAFKRTPISTGVLHQVNLRDQRRCTQQNDQGVRCNQSRFIEVHHQIPVSGGGQNTVDNLITLCSAHHQYIHRKT